MKNQNEMLTLLHRLLATTIIGAAFSARALITLHPIIMV